MKKKENVIIRKHSRMLKMVIVINLIALAFTSMALIPLYEGSSINLKAYKVLLTIMVIIDFTSAALISIPLDHSTDKPEELKAENE